MLRKTSIIILFLIFAIPIFVFAEEINWVNSLEEGLKIAEKNIQPVMVDFYTDWCGWCKKLDQDTYSNPKVQELASKFVCIKLDGDKDRDSTKRYGIDGYPTIVFMDFNGSEIDRNVGYTGPDELAKMIESSLEKFNSVIHQK